MCGTHEKVEVELIESLSVGLVVPYTNRLATTLMTLGTNEWERQLFPTWPNVLHAGVWKNIL